MIQISASKIKDFKACRRKYFFKHIEKLEPIEKSDALQTGLSYHAKLEELYKTGEVDSADFSKVSAMAEAYKKYIYPHFTVETVESWQTKPLTADVTLIGRVDGMAASGFLVEHKTTSKSVSEFEFDLQWDEQILAYMWMTGARYVYYTVCRKPTIRQKKGESDEEFFCRMKEWYDTETAEKIGLLFIGRSDGDIKAFERELLWLSDDIAMAEESPDRHCYRNTCHCNAWGRRCEYSGICLGYDPGMEYAGLVRKGDDNAKIYN